MKEIMEIVNWLGIKVITIFSIKPDTIINMKRCIVYSPSELSDNFRLIRLNLVCELLLSH